MHQLGYKSLQDFYSISPEIMAEYGGKALLDRIFSRSFMVALPSIYPFHSWAPWRHTQSVQAGYWKNKINQRQFMDWLFKSLEFKQMDDWYNVEVEDISNEGGISLLNMYGGSPSKLLQSVYPEHPWLVWQFKISPKGFWDDKINQMAFMDWLFLELPLKRMEDWYSIGTAEIRKRGGDTLLRRYDTSLKEILESLYPHHPWSPKSFHIPW
jgi:hypothetical protein